jgi:FimV-like protein
MQWCYLQQDRFGAAIILSDRYADQFSKTPLAATLLSRKAELLYNQNQYDSAIHTYRKLIQEYPTSPQTSPAWFWIGMCHIKKRRYTQALEAFENQRSQFPEDPMTPRAMCEAAEIHFKEDRLKESRQAYRELIEDYPESDYASEASVRLGEIAVTTGETMEAEATFRNIIGRLKGKPISNRARVNLAKLYIKDERLEEASHLLKDVVESTTDETAAEAQFLMGRIAHIRGDSQKAAGEFLKVKYLYPDHTSWVVAALYEAARADEELRRWEEARKLYQSIISDYGDEDFRRKAQDRFEAIKDKK